MKNIYVQVIFLLITTTTFGQIKFAPEFGANLAMQTQRYTPDTLPSSSKSSEVAPGFNIGLNIDIKLLRNLHLNTGPSYFFNNVKYIVNQDFTSKGLGTLKYEQYDRVHYLRVPFYVMYKSGFEGMGRFIAGAGAYAAYAIGGNRVESKPAASYDPDAEKYSAVYYQSNTQMKFGDDVKDNMRRWDYGLNGCIGYESNVGLYFRGWANYGLVNLDPENSSIMRVRNWGFGLSVGFLIGRDNW